MTIINDWLVIGLVLISVKQVVYIGLIRGSHWSCRKQRNSGEE